MGDEKVTVGRITALSDQTVVGQMTVMATEYQSVRDQLNRIESKLDKLLRKDGIWKCTKCGHVEFREREIKCWECGQGEMVWQLPKRKESEDANP